MGLKVCGETQTVEEEEEVAPPSVWTKIETVDWETDFSSSEMASTGVLPFIRGVDLSGNDFKVRILSSLGQF